MTFHMIFKFIGFHFETSERTLNANFMKLLCASVFLLHLRRIVYFTIQFIPKMNAQNKTTAPSGESLLQLLLVAADIFLIFAYLISKETFLICTDVNSNLSFVSNIDKVIYQCTIWSELECMFTARWLIFS